MSENFWQARFFVENFFGFFITRAWNCAILLSTFLQLRTLWAKHVRFSCHTFATVHALGQTRAILLSLFAKSVHTWSNPCDFAVTLFQTAHTFWSVSSRAWQDFVIDSQSWFSLFIARLTDLSLPFRVYQIFPLFIDKLFIDLVSNLTCRKKFWAQNFLQSGFPTTHVFCEFTRNSQNVFAVYRPLNRFIASLPCLSNFPSVYR